MCTIKLIRYISVEDGKPETYLPDEKDSDPVMFRFLQTKTGFVTYFIILT